MLKAICIVVFSVLEYTKFVQPRILGKLLIIHRFICHKLTFYKLKHARTQNSLTFYDSFDSDELANWNVLLSDIFHNLLALVNLHAALDLQYEMEKPVSSLPEASVSHYRVSYIA